MCVTAMLGVQECYFPHQSYRQLIFEVMQNCEACAQKHAKPIRQGSTPFSWFLVTQAEDSYRQIKKKHFGKARSLKTRTRLSLGVHWLFRSPATLQEGIGGGGSKGQTVL